jgi:hypothetical protein
MTELQNFLYSLLGKRKRRLLILTRWHSTKCVAGDTTEQVMLNFCKCILYEPLELSLHTDHLKLFATTQGLRILYDWLLPNERKYVLHVFVNRYDYFKQEKHFYLNGNFTLKAIRGELPEHYRREIIRDFVWMCMSSKHQPVGAILFVRICQKLLLERPTDRFVREMHEALQGRCKLKDVLCVW